ncbi:glycoside hydrolase family 76 protein [Kribbella sp. NPDC056861]|uniref:glycoside hydrolase family 76 protein n=1 Tax=Kribbella sp. NPDC056861 TaxID=3154857 RepID=UPI003435A54A
MMRILLAAVLLAVLLPAPAAEASQTKLEAAQVCSVACDTLDPSRAQEETFPVAEKVLNGRRIVLHVSDKDAMGWASIDNGSTGNAVWLDRSWDGGATWDGLLGKATIPSSWTGTRTLMYNQADPAGHRRGLIRACGDASGVVCTDWAHVKVCDAACDGSASPVGDSQPVPSTTLANRRIALHVDNRGMAWATIDTGRAGDEIWLDRSWNEGASWPGGSSLGRLSVPSGATSTKTALFATKDPKSKLYGGAVRACGRAVEGSNGACTAWARPATDRAAAAADALMYSYRPDTAWWLSSWWNSAVAVTTLMDYQKRTNRTDLRWIVDRTFTENKGVFPAGVKSGDALEGNFISRAIDDTEWWAIAWIQAYDLTGDRKYLDMAVTIANYVHGYWDTSTCGGGVWWDRERTYKNAITNGLYVRMTAALHNRLPSDTVWLQRATTGWNWFQASGMINSAKLVNDGLTNACGNNGQTVWTYNQGLAIGGALELWRATGNAALLTSARQLADAAIASSALSPNGILTETCDVGSASCDDNQKQFKGIFMRYLTDLADATGAAAYRTFAPRQSDTIWQSDRDSLNRLGQRWTGQGTNPRDWRTQASALGGILAATP